MNADYNGFVALHIARFCYIEDFVRGQADPSVWEIIVTLIQSYDWLASYFGALLALATLIIAGGARQAAKEAAKKVFRVDAVNTLSKVNTLLDQAQEHQRNKEFCIVPSLYLRIQSHIVLVRDTVFYNDKKVSTELTSICSQIRIAKDEVERRKEEGETINVPKINGVLTEQSEKLNAILAKIKRG